MPSFYCFDWESLGIRNKYKNDKKLLKCCYAIYIRVRCCLLFSESRFLLKFRFILFVRCVSEKFFFVHADTKADVQLDAAEWK